MQSIKLGTKHEIGDVGGGWEDHTMKSRPAST